MNIENNNYFSDYSCKRSIIFSSIGASLIIIGIYFFGYLYADKNSEAFSPAMFGGLSNYSVSNAIGNGQKEAISVCIGLAMISILISLYYRINHNKKLNYINYFLVIGISSFLISIVYINGLRLDIMNDFNEQNRYNDLHIPLAITAFILNLIFIILTSYQIFKQYKEYKIMRIFSVILPILELMAFVSIIVVLSINQKATVGPSYATRKDQQESDAFDFVENIQIVFFIVTVLILGIFPLKKS